MDDVMAICTQNGIALSLVERDGVMKIHCEPPELVTETIRAALVKQKPAVIERLRAKAVVKPAGGPCFDCGVKTLDLCAQHYARRFREEYQGGGSWWQKLCADYNARHPLTPVSEMQTVKGKGTWCLILQAPTRHTLDEAAKRLKGLRRFQPPAEMTEMETA